MIRNCDENKYNKKRNLGQQSQDLFLQKETIAEKDLEVQSKHLNAGKSFPLAMACEGEYLHIVKLKGSEGTVRRLIAMGLVPGTEVQLINIIGGSVILAIADNRIGLGVGMAQKVMCIKQFN